MGSWSLPIRRIWRDEIAIEAGVDVLAHTPEDTRGIDEAMLRQMVSRRMTIVPTLMLFARDDTIADIRELAHRFRRLGGRVIWRSNEWERLRNLSEPLPDEL